MLASSGSHSKGLAKVAGNSSSRQGNYETKESVRYDNLSRRTCRVINIFLNNAQKEKNRHHVTKPLEHSRRNSVYVLRHTLPQHAPSMSPALIWACSLPNCCCAERTHVTQNSDATRLQPDAASKNGSQQEQPLTAVLDHPTTIGTQDRPSMPMQRSVRRVAS